MVLVNDKKFACGTCIKGHRVSGCTHSDRPLFEIKKKGRPSTQCKCCKDKRKSGAVHNKCICGDDSAPAVQAPDNVANSSRTSGSTTPIEPAEIIETRKGQPGSSATFPNGLRDVHEINAAVEALTGFTEDPMRSAERSVQHLLNPCTCKHTGICKCCAPKRPARRDLHAHTSSTVSRSSGSRTPDGQNHTEQLVELFKSKAPASYFGSGSATPRDPSPISPSSGHHSQPSSRHAFFQHLPVPDISPENPHHPAHTSKHVHKTKLYSPYSHSASSRHSQTHSKRESLSRQGATSPRPQTLPLRPLGDMSTFLGALFQQDGTVATSISRTALGLPGIHSFDALADQGGVKSEPMEWEESSVAPKGSEDVDMPLAFPTMEDVHIGACTCGEGCRCAGCVTHPNASSQSGEDNGRGGTGGCVDAACKSCFDCSDHLHIPAGMTSIEHLLATAAANVPKPVRKRTNELKGMDTSIAPPSAAFSPESAANSGFVQLKPLECCNGRCQCRPGECVCEKDCCGCCVRCACGEDAPTPTADTFAGNEAGGSCCSASQPAAPVVEKGSCCETGKTPTPRLSLSTASASLAPPGVSPIGAGFTPPRLSPASAGGFTFNPSPYHSPLDPSSSSASGSSHHSPLLSATYHPSGMPAYSSTQTSPNLNPGHFSTALNLDQFQLPSPGLNGFDASGYPLVSPSAADMDFNSFIMGTDDGAPGLRRAASISNGHAHHAHSQSTSSTLAARRATVTAGSGVSIQRSASTGKQASKALALNHPPHHPHVRTLAPKAVAGTSHSTLLAPPKAGASSSRGNSPTGRRRSTSSTQHSRATSPGPSDPTAQYPPQSARYAHGSVDLSDPTGSYLRIPSLPIVTTSAPDETSQQVSFDPTLPIPGMDDPEITALLNQFVAEGGYASGGGDDGGLNMAGRGGLDDSFTFGMPNQGFQPRAQTPQDQVPFDFDQFLALGGDGSVAGSETQNGTGVRPASQQSHHSSGIPDDFPGWFPGMPTYYPSYPPTETVPQTSQPPSKPPSSAGPSKPPSTETVSLPNGASSVNPNLIDLSQPLNADHLERIMKALAAQQRAQSTSPNPNLPSTDSGAGQVPLPNSNNHSMPPPPLPSSNVHKGPSDTFRPQIPAPDTLNPFDPSILNQKRHNPSFSISSFDSFLAPLPSDSSGSGSAQSTLHSGDHPLLFNGDDGNVFDQFILDNPGEGLDLSALDLGNGSGSKDGGEMGHMGLGEEGIRKGDDLGFGMRMEDWVWNQDNS